MREILTTMFLGICATQALAENSVPLSKDTNSVLVAAHRLFPNLPELQVTARLLEECGADGTVNDQVAFCTSDNLIYYRADRFYSHNEPYELAHVLGHAVQVRHGVADVALREIRARPDEEEKLRGWVTRQVECIAGVLYAEAGLARLDLRDLYDAEPMTGSHWGRNPLSIGPKVSIGLEARAEWFAIGQQRDLGACAVGEFGSELLIKALR